MSKPNPITQAALESGEPHLREVGVGPWEQEYPGQPRPDDPQSAAYDPRFDSALLDEGDRRNVLDKYRYWTVEAIRQDLDQAGRHSFEVAIENWTHDFNIGSIVRTANAFQTAAVHIVGPHKWNRKGSLMTELYQRVDYQPSIAQLAQSVRAADRQTGQSTRIIAIDNLPGSVPIETYSFPDRCLLLFGAEGPGLSREALELADDIVYISQFGSVRSLNAGAAAAVAMHSWIAQHVTFGTYHEAMPTFTREQIDHLGDLARIALSDDEAERLQKDLNVIAESIQKVQEVAGDDVPPTANPVPLEAYLREDVAVTPLTQQEALAGGPRTEAGMFVAPQILGGE